MGHLACWEQPPGFVRGTLVRVQHDPPKFDNRLIDGYPSSERGFDSHLGKHQSFSGRTAAHAERHPSSHLVVILIYGLLL